MICAIFGQDVIDVVVMSVFAGILGFFSLWLCISPSLFAGLIFLRAVAI